MDCGATQNSKSSKQMSVCESDTEKQDPDSFYCDSVTHPIPKMMSVCESETEKHESVDYSRFEKPVTGSFNCDSINEEKQSFDGDSISGERKHEFSVFDNFELPLRAYYREMEEELMQVCSPKPDSQATLYSSEPPIPSDLDYPVNTQDVPLSQISILEAEFENSFVLMTDSNEMAEIDRSMLEQDTTSVFFKNSQEMEDELDRTEGDKIRIIV